MRERLALMLHKWISRYIYKHPKKRSKKELKLEMRNKVRNEIIGIAQMSGRGWKIVEEDKAHTVIAFKKYRSSYRIKVFYDSKPMIIQTKLQHTYSGKTRLYRKVVSFETLEKIFRNPRVHTARGYKLVKNKRVHKIYGNKRYKRN